LWPFSHVFRGEQCTYSQHVPQVWSWVDRFIVLDVVKSLLNHFSGSSKEIKQVYLDAQNEFGNTGLHWAALGGHLETVKTLMEHGASPVIANNQNYIPLDSANFNDKKEVAEYFLSQSGRIESTNQDGLNGAVKEVEVDGDETEGDQETKST
jgi:uncharacterized protein